MKKNFLYSVMALFMVLFASCSQEELISTNGSDGQIVSISVDVPGRNATTRTAPEGVNGCELRALMQIINLTTPESPAIIETITGTITGDKANFTFTKPGAEITNYTCIFWVDYVKTGANAADNLYNTASLMNVSYSAAALNTTGAGLFNSAEADAFCGTMSKSQVESNDKNVTLKRPFTKINVNPADTDTYTNVEVSFSAPSGFNVLTGLVEGAAQTISYNGAVAAAGTTWFSNYIFTGANVESGSTLNSAVSLTLSDGNGASKNFEIPAGNIGLNQNYVSNNHVTITESNEVSVEVTIDADFNTVKMAIGDFIYADGTFGKTAEGAVGIVFALGGKDDTSDYGNEFSGKKIAGYAMGLTSVNRIAINKADTENEGSFVALPTIANTSTDTSAPWLDDDYNGYRYSATWEAAMADYGSPLLAAYATWKSENTFTGSNLSKWYIPSSRQLADLIGLTYGYDGSINDAQVTELNIPAIAKNEALAKAVSTITPDEKSYFGRHTGNSNILSSFVRGGRLVCVQTSYATEKEGIRAFLGVSVSTTSASPFALRPVLTVFEAE